MVFLSDDCASFIGTAPDQLGIKRLPCKQINRPCLYAPLRKDIRCFQALRNGNAAANNRNIITKEPGAIGEPPYQDICAVCNEQGRILDRRLPGIAARPDPLNNIGHWQYLLISRVQYAIIFLYQLSLHASIIQQRTSLFQGWPFVFLGGAY